MEKEYIVQLPKKSKYGEVKKRIADCINAARVKFVGTESDGNTPFADTDIRLWKFSDQKEKLIDSCKQISTQRDS